METPQEKKTLSMDSLKIQFREDVRARPEHFGGTTSWVLEDPVTGKFYRIGEEECRFIRALDGTKTIQEHFGAWITANPSFPFTPEEIKQMVNWVLLTGLGETGETKTPYNPSPSKEVKTGQVLQKGLSGIFYTKIPLGCPDAALERINASLPWLFSRSFAWVLGCFILMGGATAWHQSERLLGESEGFLSPHNWLALGAGWLFLKAWHELFHGLACKKYSVPVREAGVSLILFAPLAYIDTTDAWRLSCKWQRIVVSASGVMAEVFAAALATLAWAASEPGLARNLALNIMVLGSTATVFFNANPLMRFDGYYILADLLEMPNLWPRAQQAARALARRFFFGAWQHDPISELHGWRARFVFGYGLATFVWRLLIMLGLLFLAAALGQGAGLFVALLAGFAWFIKPTVVSLRPLFVATEKISVQEQSFFRRRVGLLFACLLVFMFCPWPNTMEAPAIVEWRQSVPLRADCPGFVEKVLVNDGDAVKAGQVLLRLSNAEQTALLEKLETERHRRDLKARLFYQKGDVAGYQAERLQLKAAETRCSEKKRYVESLLVRAPFDGVFLGRRMEDMTGRFYPSGEVLSAIALADGKDLRVAVPQEQAEIFLKQVGSSVWINVRGRAWPIPVRGTLERMSAGASREIFHPALGAQAGGPLSVERSFNPGDKAGVQFSDPVFEATVCVAAKGGGEIFPGQRARVFFFAGFDPAWKKIYSACETWLIRLWKKSDVSAA